VLSLVHYILLSCAMTNHEPEQGFKASSVDQLVTQFLQSIRETIRCCPWWSVRPVQRAGVQCGYRGRSGVVTRQRCCSPTCRDEPAAMVRCKQVPNQAWRPTPRRQSICTPRRQASAHLHALRALIIAAVPIRYPPGRNGARVGGNRESNSSVPGPHREVEQPAGPVGH
jgi:hypothetical protein